MQIIKTITFGTWLRKALHDLEYKSQSEFARDLEVSPKYVSAWINDKALPNDKNIRSIAKITKTDYNDLAFWIQNLRSIRNE